MGEGVVAVSCGRGERVGWGERLGEKREGNVLVNEGKGGSLDGDAVVGVAGAVEGFGGG